MPLEAGAPESRWSLKRLQAHCPVLADLKSLSGVWRRLTRWHIAWKRGRQKLHSPDPAYAQKVARLKEAQQQAQENPQQQVFFYGDEKTVYRWPPPGQAWEQQGSGGASQPTAPRGTRANTKHRWAGMLNATSGQVFVREGAKAGCRLLRGLLEDLREAHPGQHLTVAWDNWPVHTHRELLAAAEKLQITLLFLPTYAPWTNPIEKLWGYLQAKVLAMHRHTEEFERLLARCRDFFAQFARASPDLLRYVGLLPD